MTAFRYRHIRVGNFVQFFDVNSRYEVRRAAPWWKFWVLRKFKVVQRWDWHHPFLGFTKRQATKFVAELNAR